MKALWKPQPRQWAFLARDEYEVLYGGAAGGGKSDALLVEAVRQIGIPHYRGLLLRKTYPQLAGLIDRSRELYRGLPGARYNSSQHFWRFASGAKVLFGSMQRPQDRVKYQGQQYDFIGFDELTHFTWEEYSYMFSRNRPNGPGTEVYIRAATNPGGVGHGWVKERFISPAPPLEPILESFTAPDGQTHTRSRVFVPATVYDNKELLRNDPDYVASMAMLPEAERAALLLGSWDSFSGQVFREWRDNPEGYRTQRFSHVVEPFPIPAHWRIYRGFDWGYARPFSVGWYAADTEGRLYRVAEYYGCTGAPNVGLRLDPVEVAAQIRRMEHEHPLLQGRDIDGIADPSIFDESRGESIAALMARHPNGIYFQPGDNTRIAGKMQLHYRLAFDEEGRAHFYVFSTCRHFIRTFPALVYDETRVEDVDSAQEDHSYDECRYVCMARPMSPPLRAEPKGMDFDPLNQGRPMRDPIKWYRV